MTAAVPAKRIDQDDQDRKLLAQQAGVEALRELPAPRGGNGFQLLLDPGAFEHMQRVAKLYAASNLVPQAYRGNIADCFIGLQMAIRLGVDPFMFLQSTYVVHGRPGMLATLAIALMNERGPFRGPVMFKLDRDPAGKIKACTAYATHKTNGEVCEATVTWEMVEAEGWNKPKGTEKSKWMTIPEQMFRYRSATFLARVYCPEVLMGMKTTDEADDTFGATRYIDATVLPPSTAETQGGDLAKRLGAGKGETVDTQTGEVKGADAGTAEAPSPAAGNGGEPAQEAKGPAQAEPGTAAAAAPAAPAPSSGAPSPFELLVVLMSETNDNADPEQCRARLVSHAKAMYKRTPDKLTTEDRAKIAAGIKSKTVTLD